MNYICCLICIEKINLICKFVILFGKLILMRFYDSFDEVFCLIFYKC